jgi:hypothetical protein
MRYARLCPVACVPLSWCKPAREHSIADKRGQAAAGAAGLTDDSEAGNFRIDW